VASDQLNWRECALSVFQIHNETGNIWTHLLPSLIFCAVLLYILVYLLDNFTFLEKIVFSYSLVAGITCFVLSAAYHTFSCHSQQAFEVFLRLDLSGIIMAMNGGMFTSTFFGYYCFPTHRNIYCALIMTLGLFAVFALLYPIFQTRPAVAQTNGKDTLRTVAITLYLCSGFFPLFHWVYLHGVDSEEVNRFLGKMLQVYLYMSVGFVFYYFYIPERWFVGTFDIIGSSHQFWHIFSMTGPVLQVLTGLDFLDWIQHNPCKS